LNIERSFMAASRFRKHVYRFIVAAIIIMIGACAGLGRFLETPHVSIAKIRVQEIGLLEQVYQVDLRVLNPNGVPLVIKGLDCTLAINDMQFAHGVSTAEATIPALGTGIVPINLHASLPDVMAALKNLQEGDQFRYTVTGKLHTGGGFLLPSVISYSFKGIFSLKETKDRRE
jgi:LEA14-like dessication related protein